MIKKCACCGQEFDAAQNRIKYCSELCQQEARRKRARDYGMKHKEKRKAAYKKWCDKQKGAKAKTIKEPLPAPKTEENWLDKFNKADAVGQMCMIAAANGQSYGWAQIQKQNSEKWRRIVFLTICEQTNG